MYDEKGFTKSNYDSLTKGTKVITVQGQYNGGADRYGNTIKYIDRTKFNEAIDKGIFPQLNGLAGLIKNINYWATFNNFSRNIQTGNELSKEDREREYLDEIYEFTDEDFQSPENDPDLLERQKNTVNELQANQGYEDVGMISYLTRLAQFQSNSFERLLVRKLSLQNSNNLRNYVIPRGDRIKQAYIRWDALTCLFNEYLIPRSEKGQSIFIVTDRAYDIGEKTSKIDPLLYTPISNYTQTQENTIFDFSCDANICLLPHQFGETQTQGVTIDTLGLEDTFGYMPNLSVFPTDYLLSIYRKSRKYIYDNKPIDIGLGNFRAGESKLKDSDRYRRIGSIFLNVNMLLEIAEQNEDNDDYTLGKFINDIWDKVNKVCPNHNFVLTDDKESNTLFIIDLPVDNTEVPTDFHEFIPFSNKNILRNFDYTSNVPSALSSTVAIQSQSPRSIRDIDGVTFAAFNKSIKNRIFSLDVDSDFEKTKLQLQSEKSKLVTRQTLLSNLLLTYQQSFFKNIKLSDNDKSIIGEGNIIGSLKEYQKNATYMSISITEDAASFNSVIPLEFSATLDGISGMVVGNIFKVQADRLPKAYVNSNIGFILFNEEQKITAGGDWTTDISGKMTVLPKNKISISGITISVPASDDAILMDDPAARGDDPKTELLAGQNLRTDINEAVVGDIVYLKAMKDNSPSRPQLISDNVTFSSFNVTDSDSIGFAFVRDQPYIDNEGDAINRDNSLGAFDSWNRKGNPVSKFGSKGFAVQPLGKIVAINPNDPNYVAGREDVNGDPNIEYPPGEGKAIIHYSENRIAVKREFEDVYIDFDGYKSGRKPNYTSEIMLTYDKAATDHFNTQMKGSSWFPIWAIKVQTKTATNYYKILFTEPSRGLQNTSYESWQLYGQANTDLKIAKKGSQEYILVLQEHATTQQHIFYNIQFSREASNAFNPGWVMGKAGSGDGEYVYIDTDGADNDMDDSSLELYSVNNNCYMHYSTLALTQESAEQLFIMEEMEYEGDLEDTDGEGTTTESDGTPSTASSPSGAGEFVENYRGIDIYLLLAGQYFTEDSGISGVYGSLERMREVIDENLDS